MSADFALEGQPLPSPPQDAACPSCAALRQQLAQHDCEAWRDEGIGCASCNPSAVALREIWADDPVRKERDSLRQQLAEAQQERDEAHGYLSRLFKWVWPQCEPLPTLMGVCTQIDNGLVGFLTERSESAWRLSAEDPVRKERDELREQLKMLKAWVARHHGACPSAPEPRVNLNGEED